MRHQAARSSQRSRPCVPFIQAPVQPVALPSVRASAREADSGGREAPPPGPQAASGRMRRQPRPDKPGSSSALRRGQQQPQEEEGGSAGSETPESSAAATHEEEDGPDLPDKSDLPALSPLELAALATRAADAELLPSASWMEVFVALTRQGRMVGLPAHMYIDMLCLAVMTTQVGRSLLL